MKHITLALAVSLLSISSGTALAVQVETPDITNVAVDEGVMNAVNSQLIEATNVDAAFLNTDYDPYLTVNQDANVSVTFLDEGAGYRNSLGWMTFDSTAFSGLSKGDIDLDSSGNISLNELNNVDGVNTGWLFANASEYQGGGSLLAGDTAAVGNGAISAGSSVSFFLGQNSSWGESAVSDGVFTGSDPVFYGLDFLNPEADFTSTIDSSLGNSRHVAMLFADDSQQDVIMGFEDLNRIDRYANDYNYRSDEDFNDAVFTITSDPADAFGDSNIATAPLPPLGSGLIGLLMVAGLARMTLGQPAPAVAAA